MKRKVFLQSNGKRLCAVISLPSADKALPVIVFAHGFASSKESKTQARLERMLNERGIASVRFDFFARGESDGSPEEITISKAVNNINDVISYLRGMGYARIGLCGFSFGGLASLIAASGNDGLFMLALKSPVSDYVAIMDSCHDISMWRRNGYVDHLGKSGAETRLKYSFYEDARKNIAYDAAGKIEIPVLIVHGDADDTVPLEQSVRLSEIIRNCELVVIHGADHQYTAPEHFDKMVNVIYDFITAHS